MPTLIAGHPLCPRTLLQNRVFASITILTLALGIVPTLPIFSLLNSLIRPLNVPSPIVSFASIPDRWPLPMKCLSQLRGSPVCAIVSN